MLACLYFDAQFNLRATANANANCIAPTSNKGREKNASCLSKSRQSRPSIGGETERNFNFLLYNTVRQCLVRSAHTVRRATMNSNDQLNAMIVDYRRARCTRTRMERRADNECALKCASLHARARSAHILHSHIELQLIKRLPLESDMTSRAYTWSRRNICRRYASISQKIYH